MYSPCEREEATTVARENGRGNGQGEEVGIISRYVAHPPMEAWLISVIGYGVERQKGLAAAPTAPTGDLWCRWRWTGGTEM